MLSGLENPFHVLLLFLVILLLFGAKRLPELGSGLGGGLRGFEDGLAAINPAPTQSESDPQDRGASTTSQAA